MKSLNLFLYMTALFAATPFLAAYTMEDINYFLKRSGIQKKPFSFREARKGNLMVTGLDNYRYIMVLARELLLYMAAADWDQLVEYNLKMGKLQEPYPIWKEFPCKLNNSRSKEPPITVDELRPGDIDVVAAIGDSLTAGNGLFSKQLIHTIMEFRGRAFSGGGMEDWRTALTLPNILKVFNPNLYGFSTDEVVVVNRKSHLNVAEPMIMSRDLVYQANILIARMKNDPRIDFQNHWKLLTIFIGNNDICSDMCHYDNITEFLTKHERDLIEVFTLLRNSVPRLVVNLLPVPNMVNTLHLMKNIPSSCEYIYSVGCHCVFSELYDNKAIKRANNYIKRWHAIDQYVAELPEFQTDDFIVLYQPFTANVGAPKMANGDADLRYFASDCFHFSQLGHAGMANALWNNMLQPEGKKLSVFLKPFEKFECPTEDRPFIATRKNSRK